MKILHLFHNLEIGGAQIIRLRLIQQLAKQKNQTQAIFAFKTGILEKEFAPQLEVKIFKIKSLFFFIELIKLCFFVRKFKPDIIHSLPWLPNFIARTILKIVSPSSRIICDNHGAAYHSWLHHFLDKLTYFFADRWVFVTCELRSFFTSRWNAKDSKKLVTINNGVMIPLNKKKVNNQGFFLIGVAARLDKIKRIDWLIELFAQFYSKNKNYKLLIAGSGPEKKVLQNMVNDLGLKKQIIFKEYNFWDMNLFYNSIDLLVLCSESEALPLVILEAAANGKQILVSKNLVFLQQFLTKKISSFHDEESFSYAIKKASIKKIDWQEKNYLKKKYWIDSFFKQYFELYQNISKIR